MAPVLFFIMSNHSFFAETFIIICYNRYGTITTYFGGIKMYKKISIIPVIAITIAMAIGSTVLAENQTPAIMEMTLDEAQKYAAEHNKTLRDLKDQCDDMEETYDDMVWDTRKIQNIPDKVTFESMDEYALHKGYTLEKTKYSYDELLKTKELTEQSTYYSIEKLAYEIDEAEKDLEYLRKTKAKLEKDFDIAKLKFKLEMINQTQVDQAGTALNQMNSKLKLMYDALVLKKNALKTLLGVDRNVTLKIKPGNMEFKVLGDINTDELLEKAVQNRIDAIKLTDSLNSVKMDYELYEHFKMNLGYDEYKDKKDAYEKEKEFYENDMLDIKQKVLDAYEAVMTSEQDYTVALEAYNNAKEMHRINELKYTLGMISMVDLMGSELSFKQAEIDLEKALNKNILANRKLEASYTIGDIDAAGAAASASTTGTASGASQTGQGQ